jgi:hypothetical protein
MKQQIPPAEDTNMIKGRISAEQTKKGGTEAREFAVTTPIAKLREVVGG